MEVDTGSAVRLVYCRVLQKAKTNFKLGMVTEPAVSANGRPLDIQGKCVLEIFLGGVLVAVDLTQDCLLGIDFLGKHNFKIDVNTKTIQIGREVVDLKGKRELSKVFRISLVETVVVPGRHEMMFKGAECGVLGLVKQHDLLLARVVAQPKENMVPVCVVNPSPTPVTLYQNTSVGTFCQLEDSALEPVNCNRLATKKTRRQTRPLASKEFDLDTMNLETFDVPVSLSTR